MGQRPSTVVGGIAVHRADVVLAVLWGELDAGLQWSAQSSRPTERTLVGWEAEEKSV